MKVVCPRDLPPHTASATDHQPIAIARKRAPLRRTCAVEGKIIRCVFGVGVRQSVLICAGKAQVLRCA